MVQIGTGTAKIAAMAQWDQVSHYVKKKAWYYEQINKPCAIDYFINYINAELIFSILIIIKKKN